VSDGLEVRAGSAEGLPFDYLADEVIEAGDSGGPAMRAGTHTIVAVSSAAGAGRERLARVDLLAEWIERQVEGDGEGCADDLSADGHIVLWCEDGGVRSRDCGSRGCGFDGASESYDCAR
jgi:hypothetical protein